MQDHDRKYQAKQGRLEREGKLLKDKNTEDDVNFRGEGCNVPPIYTPKHFLITNDFYEGFWVRRSSAKAPPEDT